LIDELKNDDTEVRFKAVKRLTTIATNLGPFSSLVAGSEASGYIWNQSGNWPSEHSTRGVTPDSIAAQVPC
jgi:hypothetical protein